VFSTWVHLLQTGKKGTAYYIRGGDFQICDVPRENKYTDLLPRKKHRDLPGNTGIAITSHEENYLILENFAGNLNIFPRGFNNFWIIPVIVNTTKLTLFCFGTLLEEQHVTKALIKTLYLISYSAESNMPEYLLGNLLGFPRIKTLIAHLEKKRYLGTYGKSQYITISVYLFFPGTSHVVC